MEAKRARKAKKQKRVFVVFALLAFIVSPLALKNNFSTRVGKLPAASGEDALKAEAIGYCQLAIVH
jgi:hypothetical protein